MNVFDASKTVSSLTIVTTRGDSVFKNYNQAKANLAVVCVVDTVTKCTVKDFDFSTITNAGVKAGASIPGYVKAKYDDDSVAFSHITIQLLRKLLIHHLNSCYSLRSNLR